MRSPPGRPPSGPSQGGGQAPASGSGKIVAVGGRTYGWLRGALRAYGTFVTLVQLLPAAIALLAVLLSPTAWLSPTLRRWVFAGAILGTVVGMALLARRAGPADLRRLLAGKVRTRARALTSLAWWGLGVALLAAASLRVHLATVDVGFSDSYPVAIPLFDFYLSGGRLGGAVFNGLAGLLSAALIGGLVAGAPAALLRWREIRQAESSLSDEGGPLAALDLTVKALDESKATLSLFKQEFVKLQLERDELAARYEVAVDELERARVLDENSLRLQEADVTSEEDPLARHAPHATSGRPRR